MKRIGISFSFIVDSRSGITVFARASTYTNAHTHHTHHTHTTAKTKAYSCIHSQYRYSPFNMCFFLFCAYTDRQSVPTILYARNMIANAKKILVHTCGAIGFYFYQRDLSISAKQCVWIEICPWKFLQ